MKIKVDLVLTGGYAGGTVKGTIEAPDAPLIALLAALLSINRPVVYTTGVKHARGILQEARKHEG